ncbi:cytochrome C oxidase assembly protein [Parasedimentitalea huanghaiensis]|uniref:Cytochrome C oxidase assembly protein n=1 Tax=Parasedimentitalea huanghaiensis TaxID=2682100 RepID=A0A6L6WJJ7_9RHOB|nr:cytochrome C oxidase assembly protein [Zongyanglinia huanghaiensis]MVO16745.1 cytochrome C oxidase assembly protein [Zongyanglinia huanghaiensis]
MSFKPQHEIHQRRFGRNLGVGLSLGAFVVLVLALTLVKVTSSDFKFPQNQAADQN